jgi:group I intron endonuclease
VVGIYKIENLVNHKVYIGQSWDLKRRFKDHKKYESSIYLKRAYKKYGFENFSFEVLVSLPDKYTTQEILNKAEIDYIKAFDSINSKKGYNNDSGGSKGKPSKTVRRKQSESAKKRFESLEERKKLSEAHLGKKRKPFSEDHRKHISESKMGNKNRSKNGFKKGSIPWNKRKEIL